MKVIVNTASILQEISTFENYINNNLPAFSHIEDKEHREITILSFKLFELQEFQRRARAYFSFINYCSPESESNENKYLHVYGKIEDVLTWLVSEISITQKSIFK